LCSPDFEPCAWTIYFLKHHYRTSLEEDGSCCWWEDQQLWRGGGGEGVRWGRGWALRRTLSLSEDLTWVSSLAGHSLHHTTTHTVRCEAGEGRRLWNWI